MNNRTSNSTVTSNRSNDETSVSGKNKDKGVFRREIEHVDENTSTSDNDNESDNSSINDEATEDVQRPVKFSWTSEVDLVLNCIGFSVGLGNLWRFPYLAFKNGGGAFIIPYVILTIGITFPMYYMELLLGQMSGLGPSRVWSFSPFFKGLGITVLFCILVTQVYYNVIMSYAIFYLVQTFRGALPWSECFSWWGADDNCYEIDKNVVFCRAYEGSLEKPPDNCSNASEAAADQFWKIYVLGLSTGLDDQGTIKWDLTLVLLATWVIVGYLVIHRHHSKMHMKIKTIYFTALYPFLVLFVYLFYATTLKGAMNGIGKLFVPKWSSLLDVRVWSEAAQASLYSAGIGMGGLIIFGSKNDYHYNTPRCAFISTSIDLFASLLAATVTFMIVGFLAEEFHLKFTETTLSGHGLVFVTFPDAVLNMSLPNFWAFAFFLMLFSLAVDASVATTQTLVSGTHILFCPQREDKILNVVLISAFLFIAGLSCVTNGGAFVLNILDHYGGGITVMGTVTLEAIAFGWGLGMQEVSKNVEKMQGTPPNLYMRVCWTFLAPISLIVLFLYTAPYSSLSPLYNIPYPSYADAVGWTIVAVALLPVPIWMGIAVFRHRKKLRKAFRPTGTWKKAIYLRERNLE